MWSRPSLVTPAKSLRQPEVVGIAALAVHNVVVNRALSAPADAALSLVTAAGSVAYARQRGGSADLGLSPKSAPAGLRVGAAAATVAAGGVALLVLTPGTRELFRNDRLADLDGSSLVYDLCFRIPMATALAEELMFRSALPALLRRTRSPRRSAAWSSAFFGLWHVLPALDRRDGRSGSVARPNRAERRRRWLAVAATLIATTGAGELLAWLRLRSGSVLAPFLAHSSINLSAYVAARAVGHSRR